MQAQSNLPLPTTFQRWKEGQMIYYFDHKDNGVQKAEEEGRRYTAEFTIVKSIEKADVEAALIRSILNPLLEKCVVDNIEVEAKMAIEIVKDYKADVITLAKVSAILVKTPIEIKPIEITKTK